MITTIDHDLPRGPSPVPGEQQEAAPLAAAHGDALVLRPAMQAAWAELQAVPSYVERQARAFVQVCDEQGIEAEAEATT
jgi:hypothetical protein